MIAITDRHRWLAAAAVVVVAACLFFWPFVFQGRIPVDSDFILAETYPWKAHAAITKYNVEHLDPVLVMYPLKKLAMAQLARGEFPLWNPYILGGTPLLAAGMAQPLSPFNGIFFLGLPFPVAWGVSLLAQFLLAGLGMLAFLRAWRVGAAAATVGALAWMLNGMFSVWLEHAWYVGAFSWLPISLLLVERAFERRTVGWAAWAGVAVAFQVLAGAPQATLYTVAATAAYAAWRAVAALRRERAWGRVTALACVMGGVALALSASQIAASAELAGVASRNIAKYAWGNFLNPATLIGYVAPHFFGYPVDGTYVGGDIFYRSYIRLSLPYVGVLPLLLAALALGWLPWRRTWFFALLALGPAAFFMSLLASPWYRLARSIVPSFDALDHHRALGVSAFGAAVLAALAFDAIARRTVDARRVLVGAFGVAGGLAALMLTLDVLGRVDPARITAVVTAVRDVSGGAVLGGHHSLGGVGRLLEYLATLNTRHGSVVLFGGAGIAVLLAIASAMLLALRARYSSAALTVAAVVMVVADLIGHGGYYNPYNASATVYPENPTLRFLAERAGDYRVAGLDPVDRPMLRESVLPPNAASMYGLHDPRGYESLHARWVYELMLGDEIGNGVFRVPGDIRLLQLLSVKYVVTAPSAPSPPLRLVHEEAGARIWEVPNPLPRAFFVGRAALLPSDAAVRAHVRGDGHDARGEVALVAGSASAPPAAPTDDAPATGHVRVTDYAAHDVRLAVEATGPGWVVLNDAYFPGWRASVDGTAAPVVRANHAFRAVRVPAGARDVRFEYRPAYWTTSAALAGLGVLTVLGASAPALLTRRRSRAAAASLGARAAPSGVAR